MKLWFLLDSTNRFDGVFIKMFLSIFIHLTFQSLVDFFLHFMIFNAVSVQQKLTLLSNDSRKHGTL